MTTRTTRPATRSSATSVDPGSTQGSPYPATLRAVIATDHLRLVNLLDELDRESETPGVHEDLTAQLVHDLDRHLASSEIVVHPDVRSAIGEQAATSAMGCHHELRTLLDALRGTTLAADSSPPGVPQVARTRIRRAFAHHVRQENELVDQLDQELGAKHLVKLGLDFSAAVDAGVRPLVPKQPPDPIS